MITTKEISQLTQRAQMKWEVKREKKIENDSGMKSESDERWAMLHRRFG